MTSQKWEVARENVTASPTEQLASVALGCDVKEFIAQRRAEGRSWRRVSRDIYDATDRRIDVTYETVRRWASTAA